MSIGKGIDLGAAIAEAERLGRSKEAAKRLFMSGATQGIAATIAALKDSESHLTPEDVLQAIDEKFEKIAKEIRQERKS